MLDSIFITKNGQPSLAKMFIAALLTAVLIGVS